MPTPEAPKKRGPKGPSRFTQDFIEATADALLTFIDKQLEAKQPLFLSRFAYTQGIARQEFSEWSNKAHPKFNQKFRDAYIKFQEIQESDIAEGAMTGRYDAGFSFRALKNVSGWRDEQHIKSEHTERKVVLIRDSRARRETTSLLAG